MIESAEYFFSLRQGTTFDPFFELWEDDAQTVPFLLDGYDIEMDIGDGMETLTVGNGLSLAVPPAANNQIYVLWQTTNVAPGSYKYRITFILNGNVQDPFYGVIQVEPR